MAVSRGGLGKEVAGARMKKRAMGASRQGKKMAPAEMMMPPMAMKKGGMAKKKMMGGGMAMKPGGMGYKKGGIALMIVLGKGGGKKKSK
jgi:hypothetical protein